MSHSFLRQAIGAAAAATAGLLLVAGSAQAAPKTVADPTKVTVSAAEIAANNAAVRKSLPPNVTMTVLENNGLTNATGSTALAWVALPYSYTFSGVWSWDGRDFRSTQTRVCKDIKVRWDFPEESYHKFQVSLRGSAVTVPTDNVARSYCWSGVPTNTTIHFYYSSTNNSGGDIAKASGSGQVRYP